MNRESALSRNIILVLIVSLAVIIVAVGVVMLLFPPQPDVVPTLNANVESTGNVVYIYHDGGTPLQKDRTIIMINGQEIPESSITFLHSQDWPWTAGKTLRAVYSGADTPGLVQVIYSSGSQQQLIYSTEIQGPQQTPIPISTIQAPQPATSAVTAIPTTLTSPGVTPVILPPGSLAPQPPISAFNAEPQSGQYPLSVSFADVSSGSPDTWLWYFGDGESSTERNPVHTYRNAGTYTVTLTVSNPYGSSTKTKPDYITSGLIPAANFVATPGEGPAPLEVRFNDLSTGNPTSWSWDFGDGTTSTEHNPSHTYYTPGSYSVTLSVSNQFGTNSRYLTNYMKVTEPVILDVFIDNCRNGYLVPDGYLQFTVTDFDAQIKIAGSIYRFREGDTVQLFIGNPENGEIDVNANGITSFSFDDVRMYVNGEFAERGIVSSIYVPRFEGLKSTFTLFVPAGEPDILMYVNGGRVFNGDGKRISVINLKQDSSGRMYYSQRIGNVGYRGGADAYKLG
jgi:PKD repeat protein